MVLGIACHKGHQQAPNTADFVEPEPAVSTTGTSWQRFIPLRKLLDNRSDHAPGPQWNLPDFTLGGSRSTYDLRRHGGSPDAARHGQSRARWAWFREHATGPSTGSRQDAGGRPHHSGAIGGDHVTPGPAMMRDEIRST